MRARDSHVPTYTGCKWFSPNFTYSFTCDSSSLLFISFYHSFLPSSFVFISFSNTHTLYIHAAWALLTVSVSRMLSEPVELGVGQTVKVDVPIWQTVHCERQRETARNSEKLWETVRDSEKQWETARDSERQRETARDSEKQRETARNGEK